MTVRIFLTVVSLALNSSYPSKYYIYMTESDVFIEIKFKKCCTVMIELKNSCLHVYRLRIDTESFIHLTRLCKSNLIAIFCKMFHTKILFSCIPIWVVDVYLGYIYLYLYAKIWALTKGWSFTTNITSENFLFYFHRKIPKCIKLNFSFVK